MGRIYRDREQGTERQVPKFGQPGSAIDKSLALGTGFRGRYFQETRFHGT
jgi:hypothetical protein